MEIGIDLVTECEPDREELPSSSTTSAPWNGRHPGILPGPHQLAGGKVVPVVKAVLMALRAQQITIARVRYSTVVCFV